MWHMRPNGSFRNNDICLHIPISATKEITYDGWLGISTNLELKPFARAWTSRWGDINTEVEKVHQIPKICSKVHQIFFLRWRERENLRSTRRKKMQNDLNAIQEDILNFREVSSSSKRQTLQALLRIMCFPGVLQATWKKLQLSIWCRKSWTWVMEISRRFITGYILQSITFGPNGWGFKLPQNKCDTAKPAKKNSKVTIRSRSVSSSSQSGLPVVYVELAKK